MNAKGKSMINITRGENKVFTIKVKDQDGDAFDLTDFDEFDVCLPLESGKLTISEAPNPNGSVVAILGAAINGKLQVTVNNVDTNTLKVADRQDIGVVLNNSATPNPKPKNGEGVLNVKPNPCA